MPTLLPVGQDAVIKVPADLLDRVPAFQARVEELYPQLVTDDRYMGALARIALNDAELRAMLENPDGPRQMWVFASRAVAGMEP